MVNALVTKVGDITEIVYDDAANDFERRSVNEVTKRRIQGHDIN